MLSILRRHFKISLLLTFLIVFTFGQSIYGSFLLLDDVIAIFGDPLTQDLRGAFLSFRIQTIEKALLFRLFGFDPAVFHISSIVLHLVNMFLGFLFVKRAFGRKPASIAVTLASIHPVTVESIAWISGRSYLIMALFFNIVLLLFIKYKDTQNNNYYWGSLVLSVLFTLLTKNPWMLTLPIVLLIIEQFLLQKTFKLHTFLKSSVFFFAVLLTLFFQMPTQFDFRQVNWFNASESTVSVGLNSESLTPVIQGYPFTIFSMLRLYVFPSMLTVYHDSYPITDSLYNGMFFVTFLYVSLLVFFYKKDRKIAGFLLLLVLSLAPALSPLKITWYITERYLYFGTIFYTTLFVLLLLAFVRHFDELVQGSWLVDTLSKKVRLQRLWQAQRLSRLLQPQQFSQLFLVLVIIAIGFLYYKRSTERILDWRSNDAIARSVIKTAPTSLRGYQDLAVASLQTQQFDIAYRNFNKVLQINKLSDLALKNLGLIIINEGPSYINFQHTYIDHFYEDDFADTNAKYYMSKGNYGKAAFFSVQYLRNHPKDTATLIRLGEIYLILKKFTYAQEMFSQALTLDPQNTQIIDYLDQLSVLNL